MTDSFFGFPSAALPSFERPKGQNIAPQLRAFSSSYIRRFQSWQREASRREGMVEMLTALKGKHSWENF
ncbi:MAG: hypothetical protein LBF76_01935, partial [Holosporales bacterium]|nr:hypothetical protein [Holosporales bacterium]